MTSRRYKIPNDRQQQRLLPPSLEQYVDAQNPVRAIDVYVNSLDLTKLGFQHADGGVTRGQPAYAPGDLLKLYLYGYLNKVRSSRSLEREARRNLEVIWLLGELQPAFKTIADFRKNNAKALQKTCRNFILLCRELELFGAETVAIDGSFFHGNASKGSIYTQSKLEKQIETLDKKISDYLQALDDNDSSHENHAGGEGLFDTEQLAEKLDTLKKQLEQKEAQLQRLRESEEGQLSLTDPDARLLHKRSQSVAGYNVQIAVDEKNKLLAASEVTNDGNDLQQLFSISRQAKQALQADSLNVLADSGYWDGDQLRQCELNQITPYVAFPDKTQQGKFDQQGRFSRKAFTFLAEENRYRCPAGAVLKPFNKPSKQQGKVYWRYAASRTACGACPMRDKCLTPKGTRKQILRWEHEEVAERTRERMRSQEGKEQMRRRSALAEHPFGILKRRAGWDHFLVRGFKKVKGEWSLMALGYNFTRVLNIIGFEAFMKHCDRVQAA